MRLLIATIKKWNIENALALKKRLEGVHEVEIIEDKDDLNTEYLQSYDPDFIFFPHWSYYIPEQIYENYECVVFHETDLPFGRGGSPIQNLIVRGYDETVISAIKVTKELDAGPIYMKHPLSLDGTVSQILTRASDIVFGEMIPKIIECNMTPVQQTGEPTVFKRRKREDGQIKGDYDLKTIYDYIRMLDGEGYPPAFTDLGNYCLEFTDAVLGEDTVEAKVVFRKKDDNE